MRGFWITLFILYIPREKYGIICLEDDTEESSGGDPAVIDLVQNYHENKALLESLPQPYEVIYPVQIRRNQKIGISTLERRGRHLVHMEQTVFQIDLFGETHKLKLHLNVPLLSTSMRKKYFLQDKTQIISETVDHCYYHGTIKHLPEANVAVSTCKGLSGVIQLQNATYIIQPLKGGDMGMNHPHVLYRAVNERKGDCGVHDGRWLHYQDLHEEEYVRRVKMRNANPEKIKKDVEAATKVIDLALIVDYKLFHMNNNTSEREIVQKVIMVANIADMYFKVLNLNLSIVYIEIWNTEDQMKMDPNIRKTLQNFVLYKKGTLYQVPHDSTHLLSSYAFSTDDIGLAIPESICSERAIGITRVPSLYQPMEIAATLTHMIGHNLGMKHDSEKCECSDLFGCMMKESLLLKGREHLKNFSSCSRDFFTDALSLGLGNCIIPYRYEVTYPTKCGNGIVERGEQCDCKSAQECLLKDPCCEPSTCLLQPWAFCNHGPCCKNCSILPHTHVCRVQANECDVAEYCGGNSGLCPPNAYIQDGTQCSAREGHCYRGECPTHQRQCQMIWGRDALVAQTRCYQRFNPLGTMNGHCGPNVTTHLYNHCENEDVLCGLLHCIGGTPAPLVGDMETYTKTFVSVKGQQFVCNILNSYSIPEFPQDGVVKDGTKCGAGRVCLNHKCRDVKAIMNGACPTNNPSVVCSGHGVCTNELKCVCNPFWLKEDCSVPMFQPTLTTTTTAVMPTMVDYNVTDYNASAIFVAGILKDRKGVVPNNVNGESISTKMLMIILAGVAGGLLVVLAFFMLCYRRRSPTSMTSYTPWGKKKKKEALAGNRPASLSSEEGPNANRIIKFGEMPSYREEKIKELHELKRRVLQGHYGDEEDDHELAETAENRNSCTEEIIHDPPHQPSPPPVSLDKMPEKGILKKGPRQKGRRLKKGLKLPGDPGQLSGSQMSGSETESKEGSKVELAGILKEVDKVVSGSECGSGVCSDYESMDTERESLLKSDGGERSGTLDSRILESPMGTGSPGSKEHVDSEGKVVHIRNIGDLIKNIEEQVVRQSPPATEDKQDCDNPNLCQKNLLRPEDVKTDANVQTSPLYSHPVHITDNPLYPLEEAGSESGSSESARSTNSLNGAQKIPSPVSPEPIVLTAPAPPCGPLLNFSPLHIGLQTQHHAQFSPEDNLFTCTHFSPVSSPRESFLKSGCSPLASPNESPYKPIFTPPPRLPPVQFSPQKPIIPGQTGLNQNIGKLSSFLPRPDYVPLPPSSPAHSSSESSNCSSVVKPDSPKEEKDNIPRIWQAPNRSNIPARRGPVAAVLSGHFEKVPTKNIPGETGPEMERKLVQNAPPGGPPDGVRSAPQQFYSFLPRSEKDPSSGESIMYPPQQTGRPRSCASPQDGNLGLPRKPRSRPASTSLYRPVILPKQNIPANSACASQEPDDRPSKPSNLPLTNNFHSNSSNSPEFYKTFSPIFPPHLLSADHFRVQLDEDELSSEENMNNDLSPSHARIPHSPECNINPYSPDTSPNEQPARSKTQFPMGIRSNLNTGSKVKPWNSRDKNVDPDVVASGGRDVRKKPESPKRGKKKKKKATSGEEKMSSREKIDKDLVLDV
ncbi:uncharacterized protein LOC135500353 [Lineus longissimus]|uniref:uncharacterized protein LOC135500353 n=1 Tax=Lineus longissimus TaxID=88925 RepID=UPI00315CD4B3